VLHCWHAKEWDKRLLAVYGLYCLQCIYCIHVYHYHIYSVSPVYFTEGHGGCQMAVTEMLEDGYLFLMTIVAILDAVFSCVNYDSLKSMS